MARKRKLLRVDDAELRALRQENLVLLASLHAETQALYRACELLHQKSARLYEAERQLNLKLPHGVKLRSVGIGKGCSLYTLARAIDDETRRAGVAA